MYEFRLKIHWTLFLRVQLTIFQHWFRQWLGAGQATSHYLNQWWLVHWRIYASLGLDELSNDKDLYIWQSLAMCMFYHYFAYCPACRTTLVATRFRVAVICPIIQVPHCIRVFFYFVWFVFINHIFQFYYELCTYCNILGYLPIIKFKFCQLCSVLYEVIELFIF